VNFSGAKKHRSVGAEFALGPLSNWTRAPEGALTARTTSTTTRQCADFDNLKVDPNNMEINSNKFANAIKLSKPAHLGNENI
jgi:hypothetical protein